MTENAEEGDSAEQKEQPSDGSEPSYEESEESQRKEEEAAAAVQRAFRRYAVRKRRDNEAAKRLQRTWRRKLKQNMSDAQLRSMRKWHVVATALVCSAGAAAAQLTEQWLRELDGLGTAASPRSKRQRLRQRRREERMGTRRQTAFHGHSARQDEARSKRQFQSVQRLPTISGGDEWTVSHSPITPSRIPLATPVPSCAASVGSCGAAVRGETATGSPAPSPAASRQESAPTERQAQPPSRSEEHSHGAPDSPLVAAATQPLVPEVYVPLRRRPVTAPQKRRRGNHMHLAPTRLREKAPLQVDVMMPPPLSPPPPVTPIRRARPKQKIPDIQEVLAAVPHFHALSSSDAVDIETWGTSLLEGFNMPVSAEADRRSSLLGPPKTMRRVSQRVRKASSVSGLAKSPRGRSGSTRSPSKSFFGGQGADQGSTLFQYGGTVGVQRGLLRRARGQVVVLRRCVFAGRAVSAEAAQRWEFVASVQRSHAYIASMARAAIHFTHPSQR
eukprot:TRINITY_DN14553_c0_g1_i1.p1 TRINITY_DN14553_c0_g1~~TRINITY_DN14553_c0_g1_i1.p1  ORF type:complete len:501 (+),score=74.10 TRINITY_DN14553_c0_g1_i1:86-1588(+)